jgi:hypothetical protein
MLRSLLVASFVVALGSSCASTPAKPSEGKPQAPAPSASPPPNARGESAAAAAVLPVEPHGPLARGKCVDCFDCVDTVGFPAPGYRWACVAGKCEKAKLTGFTGETQQPAEVLSNSEPAKRPAKARRSGRRHN